MSIDTTNKFMVALRTNAGTVILNPPGAMSKDDALNLAAWLVVVADTDNSFPAVLDAIQGC
jgi:hypothetical protein